MLQRAVGGLPPGISPDMPALGFHVRNKIVLAADEKSDKWRQVLAMVGSRLEESIPSTILTLISVVCCLCHIGKRQSPPGHNIDKSCTLERLIMHIAGGAATSANSPKKAAASFLPRSIMGIYGFACTPSQCG